MKYGFSNHLKSNYEKNSIEEIINYRN